MIISRSIHVAQKKILKPRCGFNQTSSSRYFNPEKVEFHLVQLLTFIFYMLEMRKCATHSARLPMCSPTCTVLLINALPAFKKKKKEMRKRRSRQRLIMWLPSHSLLVVRPHPSSQTSCLFSLISVLPSFSALLNCEHIMSHVVTHTIHRHHKMSGRYIVL